MLVYRPWVTFHCPICAMVCEMKKRKHAILMVTKSLLILVQLHYIVFIWKELIIVRNNYSFEGKRIKWENGNLSKVTLQAWIWWLSEMKLVYVKKNVFVLIFISNPFRMNLLSSATVDLFFIELKSNLVQVVVD